LSLLVFGACVVLLRQKAVSKRGTSPVVDCFDAMGIVKKDGAAFYRNLNFNQIET
jgi:hypothetical protein